jgi:hypothetical protein
VGGLMFTMVTITGTFERADGSPAQGRVTCSCSHALSNGTESIEADPIVGHLDDEGKLVSESDGPFVLAANDDADTSPIGSWYAFVLEVDSAPVRSFVARVPAAAVGGTIDLTELEG